MRSCVQTSLAGVVGRCVPSTLAVLVLAFLLVGCQQRDQIKKYTVKKLPTAERKVKAAEPAEQGPPTDRMLAALVPHGKVAWFFKVTGPKDAVAEQMENFLALIRSLKFADGDEATPVWTLPEGWTASEGNQFRFATLKVPADGETLEVAVSMLPAPDPTELEYVLANVNRWCDQLGVPPKTKDDLFAEDQPKNAEVRQFDAAGAKVTLVNLVGRQKGSGMAAPFASSNRKPAPREVSPPAANLPKWTVPTTWKSAPGNEFSIAAFVVADGPKTIKTTVSRAGGDLLANVNRWRGQMQLDAWSAEQLSQEAKKLTVDGSEATLVELIGKDARTGEPACTLGVIVPRGESSWFFKLTGEPSLAQREKANFEAFVQSVKFD